MRGQQLLARWCRPALAADNPGSLRPRTTTAGVPSVHSRRSIRTVRQVGDTKCPMTRTAAMAVTHRSMWLGRPWSPTSAEDSGSRGHQIESRNGLLGANMIDKHRISHLHCSDWIDPLRGKWRTFFSNRHRELGPAFSSEIYRPRLPGSRFSTKRGIPGLLGLVSRLPRRRRSRSRPRGRRDLVPLHRDSDGLRPLGVQP